MSRISFNFESKKLLNAVTYMAYRQVPRLDKMKLAKLLFYADKYHLLKHGRPILGDNYYCMDHGPVPSFSYNEISDAFEGEGALLSNLKITTAEKYPSFELRDGVEPDLGVFSDSEVEALDETIRAYGGKTPWELRQLSHTESCWKKADEHRAQGSSLEMPYETFFDGADSENMLELVRSEQHNRDFANDIPR